MGCVSSRRKSLPLSVFKVTSIDDKGNEKCHGQMEVTDRSLILHKVGEEPPVVWPLSTVRRYGYEESMFCFEAGRSSPLGQGIFAFKSKDAQHIFNAIREKVHTDIEINKDMSSEIRNHSSQSYTNTHTNEKADDEVSFNGLRFSSEENDNTQPPDLMLDTDTAFLPKTSYRLPPKKEPYLVYCNFSR